MTGEGIITSYLRELEADLAHLSEAAHLLLQTQAGLRGERWSRPLTIAVSNVTHSASLRGCHGALCRRA